MNKPAIVVIAYNREKSLQRLLNSIALARFPADEIPLHISIDASENKSVYQVAANFEWKFGNKIIDLKPERLGLLKHVLLCGELTQQYGSIIVLEDDVLVAPGFYPFAQKANSFYAEDEKVAGVSLFTYPVEENNFYPFQPLQDDSDVHFIQVASSWGQSWTKEQWSKFKTWLNENPQGKEQILPHYIQKWGSNSWKKVFVSYLIETNRYFVFPNISLSTNFEEAGTHASQTGFFQVPLNGSLAEPRLKKWQDSNSIYDVYFELIPQALKRLMPDFENLDVEVDLYGTKPVEKMEAEYVLTIRKGVHPERRYGATMRPLIQNLLFSIEGTAIYLIRRSNLLQIDEPQKHIRLTLSKEGLRQNAHVFSIEQKRVTIVIPALEEKELQRTFSLLARDKMHNVSILVACPAHVSEKFKHIEDTFSCDIEFLQIESSDLNQLLIAGLAACQTDYVSWAQAGMELDLKKWEKVAIVFSGMKQVNFVRGIESNITEEKYDRINSAPWRTTPSLAYYHAKGLRETSTELMVWRHSMLDEISSHLKEDYSNLFVELLKATPMYVLVDKLGSRNGIAPLHSMSKQEVRKSLKNPTFQRNWFIRFLNHPYFRPGFYWNLPFIRFVYKELGRFPMVIRYDFKNDSYFLDNY